MSAPNDFDVLYYINPDEALASNPELFKENVKQALIFCHICRTEWNLTAKNNETLIPKFRFINNCRRQVYKTHTSECLTKECKDAQEARVALICRDEQFWKQSKNLEAMCDYWGKKADETYRRGIESTK